MKVLFLSAVLIVLCVILKVGGIAAQAREKGLMPFLRVSRPGAMLSRLRSDSHLSLEEGTAAKECKRPAA